MGSTKGKVFSWKPLNLHLNDGEGDQRSTSLFEKWISYNCSKYSATKREKRATLFCYPAPFLTVENKLYIRALAEQQFFLV